MTIRRFKDLESYRAKHPAPHMGLYGPGGVGKTESVCSACRPPLNWRVLMLNTEDKALPEGLAQEIYAKGGRIYLVQEPADLQEAAREARGGGNAEKPYDVIVVDGWTVLNRDTVYSQDARDRRQIYFATEIAMHQALRELRTTGLPILSTALEDWVPTILHRDAQGNVATEGAVPEDERFYTVRLPNALKKDWPASFESLGRLMLGRPGDRGGNPSKGRWVPFAPKIKGYEAKTEYQVHLPGLYLPYGVNAAFLMLYPWLHDIGRLTEEQQAYWDGYKKAYPSH